MDGKYVFAWPSTEELEMISEAVKLMGSGTGGDGLEEPLIGEGDAVRASPAVRTGAGGGGRAGGGAVACAMRPETQAYIGQGRRLLEDQRDREGAQGHAADDISKNLAMRCQIMEEPIRKC